jgi:hypothetical protein
VTQSQEGRSVFVLEAFRDWGPDRGEIPVDGIALAIGGGPIN